MFKFIENSKYQINQDSIVKREYKNGNVHFLNPTLGKNGYLIFTIEKRKRLSVHRTLAILFIPNPNNLPFVDHINRNKIDNRLCNLRWSTIGDNNINRKRKGCICFDSIKYKNKEYYYYRVFWTLPNEKRKSKRFSTKERAEDFLKSLELDKY